MDKIIWKQIVIFAFSNKQRIFWNESSSAHDTLQILPAANHIKSPDYSLSGINNAHNFQVLWLETHSREFSSLKVGWLMVE